MPQNTHLDLVTAESERHFDSSKAIAQDLSSLRQHALDLAAKLPWLPNTPSSTLLAQRHHAAIAALEPLFAALSHPRKDAQASDDFRWLHDNVRLLHAGVQDVAESLKTLQQIPHIRTPSKTETPRVAAVSEGFLEAADFQFTEEAFSLYLSAFQEVTVLNMKELWALIPALKLILLEQIAERGSRLVKDRRGIYRRGFG